MSETRERAEYLARERAAMERHVAEHNAQLQPETPGYVRTTGPRRQYRQEIRNGEVHSIEI